MTEADRPRPPWEATSRSGTRTCPSANEMAALVDFAVQQFGRLDVMFNNAGLMAVPGTNDVSEDDFEDFERTMAVDLLGVMLGTRYAARAMRDSGGGSIINTASTTATVPGLGILSYRAAKAGVLNFTQNAAISLGQVLAFGSMRSRRAPRPRTC